MFESRDPVVDRVRGLAAALSAAERDTVQARMSELQPLYTRYMDLAAVAD